MKKLDKITRMLYFYYAPIFTIKENPVGGADPTAEIAIQNVEPFEIDNKTKRWIYAIHAVEQRFSGKTEGLIMLDTYKHQLHYKKICRIRGVSPSEYYRILHDIKIYVKAIAWKEGLVNNF